MEILVRGNEIKSVECDQQFTISQFKTEIAKKFNVPQNHQEQISLYFNGTPLSNDESTLCAYGLSSQTAVDLEIGLFGGKVHGSLARAGKVKGQTPKVEISEDKKKKITGRAKRRLQYNRRFVNVVMGPGGRRKGPNAGAGVAPA